ncbi:hypothetical protein V5R04_07645 [Jonesiaceae bacterium BS-20]|uniref:DUF4175 domain-containing protein n=1 Tax=Jonesiaceae bacterium BS-20 TaxID=3120821 RepID=A0AAU7E0K7_9MICO
MPWRTILLIITAVSFFLFLTDGGEGLGSPKTLWAIVFGVCVFLWARTPKPVPSVETD